MKNGGRLRAHLEVRYSTSVVDFRRPLGTIIGKPMTPQSPRRSTRTRGTNAISSEPSKPLPEWLEELRLTLEREAPIRQVLLRRAISAVLSFSDLSEDSVVNAAAAHSDLEVLLRALSSDEFLKDLQSVEPLAPAFIRGIEAKRRLIEEHGGTLTAEEVANNLGISRQAVEKRRQAGKLLALDTGRHGYRYPVWQFTDSGTLPGLEDVLSVLAAHDEWMQMAFFVTRNPALNNGTPVETLRSGRNLRSVLDAAEVYTEHGAA